MGTAIQACPVFFTLRSFRGMDDYVDAHLEVRGIRIFTPNQPKLFAQSEQQFFISRCSLVFSVPYNHQPGTGARDGGEAPPLSDRQVKTKRKQEQSMQQPRQPYRKLMCLPRTLFFSAAKTESCVPSTPRAAVTYDKKPWNGNHTYTRVAMCRSPFTSCLGSCCTSLVGVSHVFPGRLPFTHRK